MRHKPKDAVEDAIDALDKLNAITGLHVGALALPVTLPMWCRQSLERDASRTARSAASIARWALLWPVAAVVALALPTLIFSVLGWAEAFVLLWLVTLVAVGVLAAIRARGLGGFLLGMVGLTIGGALLGFGAWVIVGFAGVFGVSSMPVGPVEALIYIPLLAALVPTLAATPFGIGVVVGSVLAAARR